MKNLLRVLVSAAFACFLVSGVAAVGATAPSRRTAGVRHHISVASNKGTASNALGSSSLAEPLQLFQLASGSSANATPSRPTPGPPCPTGIGPKTSQPHGSGGGKKKHLEIVNCVPVAS